jgi:hypothetical protein
MSLVEIHGRLANTAMFYFLLLALWGLWRALRKQGIDSSFWGALAIGEILIILQGILGAILYFGGDRPARWVHILYGVVAVLVIPGLYAYTRGESERRVMLIYGITLLISVGVILRAISTAGGA